MTDLLSRVQPLDEIDTEKFGFEIVDWLLYYLSDDEQQRMTEDLIEQLSIIQRTDLLHIFIIVMQENNDIENLIPYVSKLLTYNISDEAVHQLSQVIDIEYYNIIDGLMEIENEDSVYAAIMKIQTLFGSNIPELATLQLLLDKARDKESKSLTKYLSELVRESTPLSHSRPLWIIDHPSGELRTHQQLIDELVINMPKPWISDQSSESINRDVEYLLGLIDESMDLEKAAIDLHNKLSRQTPEKRMANINWLRNNNKMMKLELREDIFNVLGACLPFGEAFNLKKKSTDPCACYGGCRVFTCYENSIDLTLGDDILDIRADLGLLHEINWFTGQCDKCPNKIKWKHYALRMPLETGGWRGCYCSFECIRDDIDEENGIRLRLVEGFRGMYEVSGIYERTY
jgi:hypothetical protein